MSDQLTESAERLFAAHVNGAVLKAADGNAGGPDEAAWPGALWGAVEEAGFTAALLPEEHGGFGATVAEALGLLRVSAAHAAPIPLAETMLAGRLLAGSGLPVPEGPLSLAPVRRTDAITATKEGGGWRISGRAGRVPWGRRAAGVAVLAQGPDGPVLALARPESIRVESNAPGRNVAGEPRDTLTFDGPAEAAATALTADGIRAVGAALRTVQIAGALSRILEISVGYAGTRVQFGRPIGKFQAIQHHLAVLAGHAAAATAAADIAAHALGASDAFERPDAFAIGAAKARAGEAASVASGLAHQSHGAIGFTQEYALHPFTRRAYAWRDEFGNEAEWNALVGRAALRAGAAGLWPAITAAA